MLIYAKNMQRICLNTHLYAQNKQIKYEKNMHKVCKYLQNTSAIQSVTILYTISNNTQQCHTIYNNIDKILSILYNIVVYCLILYLLKIRHNIVFKYCLILYTIPNNKLNKICYNIIQYLWLILFLNIVQYFQILFDIV
jgi:hypothetical protein